MKSQSLAPRRLAQSLALGKLLLLLVSGLAVGLIALPPLTLTLRGITTRGWEGLPDAGISEAITLSLTTTLLSIMLTLLLGTPLAYVLARYQFRFKRLVNLFIELPVVMPPAVAGLALLVTFGRRGAFGPVLELAGITLPFTTAAVVVAQTFISAPFYIRSAQVGFEGVSREVEDAARVDGAAGLALFWYITLPIARRALVAGLILSWARALGEFGATILFAGSLPGRTQTMPLLVYSVFERSIDAAIWTGVILIGLAMLALLISQWLLQRGTDFVE